MKKVLSIMVAIAFALPLSVFTVSANAGSSVIGGGMGTQSIFSTGGAVMSHADGGFIVGAGVTNYNGPAIVGAVGDYTNTARATHSYGSSSANGDLSMLAGTNNTMVNFDGRIVTGGHGKGKSNVIADTGSDAIANSSGNSVSARADMGTSGTAMSLGNVHSYTVTNGAASAFAWH